MSEYSSFRHEALLYQGPDEFPTVILPLLRDGIASGNSILAAVDPEKATLLRDELGSDSASVQFVDMRDVGRNPARIIPVWRSFVDEHAARGALGVGEPVWPGRSPAELEECELHEALLDSPFPPAHLRLRVPGTRSTCGRLQNGRPQDTSDRFAVRGRSPGCRCGRAERFRPR
jgi:hypothetical protein